VPVTGSQESVAVVLELGRAVVVVVVAAGVMVKTTGIDAFPPLYTVIVTVPE
jgi:hypothetical protein